MCWSGGGGDLMVTSNKSNIEAVSKLNIEPVLLNIESLESGDCVFLIF